MASSEFREYENGVADVLASVVGTSGVVERNVRLPSHTGVRPRQIDVLVTGSILGLTDARLIVDCKRWNRPVDAPDVEAFAGLLADVGADMGILVSAAGASEGAVNRARAIRGLRIKPLSLAELASWRPAGTAVQKIEIPGVDAEHAAKSLREAGLRVLVKKGEAQQVCIEVFRHYGVTGPSGDLQRAQHDLADKILTKLGIPQRSVSSGITISGGTPNHRWLDVHLPGSAGVLKVSAATEAELESHLGRLVRDLGIPRARLTVDRPDGWPVTAAFPF
jgi:Restriction endonuclease